MKLCALMSKSLLTSCVLSRNIHRISATASSIPLLLDYCMGRYFAPCKISIFSILVGFAGGRAPKVGALGDAWSSCRKSKAEKIKKLGNVVLQTG
jgi:hypothetical protein